MKVKIMLLLISFFILLVGIQTASSQIEIGLRADLGGSLITKTLYDYEAKVGPSLRVGVYSNFYITENWNINTGLNLDYYQGPRVGEIYFTDDNGNINGSAEHRLIINSSYLSVPVCISWKPSGFNFFLGFQASAFINANIVAKSKGDKNGEPFQEKITTPKFSLNKFDYGPRIGFGIQPSEKLFFQLSYYHGLPNIRPPDSQNTVWKIRQFTIGIQHKLWSTTPEKE